MARRITDEKVLMERVIKMLPKGVPAEAIESVECDPVDGGDYGDKPSYWVNLSAGYICPSMGCHTIHEDTLKELSYMVGEVEVWPDDPELEDITEAEETEQEDKFQIIKESESEADWKRAEYDEVYRGVIPGLVCGWNFEVVNEKGKIDYLSCHWYEGTPEQLAEAEHYYDPMAHWRWNGWELTGRVMFRWYGEEYWYEEERDWCVHSLTSEEVDEYIKGLNSRWQEYHITDMKWD